MRNLNLWNISHAKLKLSAEERFVICRGYDEESSTSAFYVCTHNLIVRNYDESGEIKWSKDLSQHSSPHNKPVNITYLSLQNIICVGLENGELFTISDAGNITHLTGIFESGLLAMEWSPDHEQLALVTKDFNAILLSCTFDVVSEVNLFGQDFGEKQFITVGWGKKETQFHGSEGKQAAKAVTEVNADPNAAIDNRIKITWRGDCHLYAIGFIIDGIRRFKVFDREGHLQYTSEKQPGVESNICWRPSGNVIATTQRLPEKYIVSFFEKNGLKHGEFNLKLNMTTSVENISWNADSEILTLQCYDSNTNSQTVLLYTTGNYHWYLKQTLKFNADQKINKLMWDNDFDISNNKKLHVILQNGQHYRYAWVWSIDHSKGQTPNDDAIVTVIDGDKLLVTGFRQTVVPPPMAALEISIKETINAINFAPSHLNEQGTICSNAFFAVTSENKLQFYKQVQKFPLEYKEFKTIQLPNQSFPFQFFNFCWINLSTMICMKIDNDGTYSLIEINLENEDIEIKYTYPLPDAATRIELHPSCKDVLFLQLINGDIIEYKIGGDIEPKDISFKLSCPKFNVITVDNKIHYIGLSYKGNLYIDDVTALNSVSSFFVHTHFLLITTLQHVILCVELTEAGLDAIKTYQKIESNIVYKRKIERGSKLVIAVPCETRTVFQMPRGNLEAIQPRPLSFKIIGELLDNLKYYEAFDLMRKQRINLNLIYDHDPEKFIKNIDVFLDKISTISWLNLFLSDLENTDVTKTMYSNSYSERSDRVTNNVDLKVNKICDIVRDHLSKRSDKSSKILPLITTYVKKNNVEELEKALSIIKDLKIKESGDTKLPVGSDEALKYLLYMVDVNHLFNVALGMYDFDLVLLVANKSQKDPKEFIPMLNELNEMDENYKKFTINKHLKRFEKAVEYLVKCGLAKHEELRTFVKYHSLYRVALSYFSTDDEIFKQISDDYAFHLKLNKHNTEAGIIYDRANNVDKAIECYKDALEWELALKLAHSLSKEGQKQLCWDLVTSLKDEKRHNEALIILEQYYDDVEETISYAIEAGHYKTALRLCAQHQKSKLRDENLLPTLIEDCKNIQELIKNNWDTFIKYRERLLFVRENKVRNPVEMYDQYANKDTDLYSDAGSTLGSSSRGSTRSYRSSKNRRKHERKVASLKEGSQYEDVALVMALHTLVTSSFELRTQMKEILIALSSFGKDNEATILQNSLEKLLKEMKESFKVIWTNELVIESTNALIAAQNVPEGCSVIPQGIASLEPHVRISPVIQEFEWKLNGFQI